METYDWISILPPLVAIFLAIKTKQVSPSLFLGIWLGWTAIDHWNSLTGLRDTLKVLINIFKNA